MSSDATTPHPPGGGAIANESGLLALGAQIDGKPAARGTQRRGSRRTRRVWLRRSIIAVGLVGVLIVAGGAAAYFYFGSLVHHVKVAGLQTAGTTENILLVGSTNRCVPGLNNPAYGLCSAGVNGVNSDIVMVVHLNLSNGSASLLSIPRDLFVPNARIEGANKIDAALYQGPSQLAAAIEEDFGIPIDHFVELNFKTFADVVNALGGISMYFPVPIYDAYSSLNVEVPGCQHLDGVHALEVVRARHLQVQASSLTPFVSDRTNHSPTTWLQEPLSDIARIRRTHEFLRVVAAKLSSQGLSNPITDLGLARSVLPDLTVDDGFSEGHMVSLAQTFAGVSIGNVPQLTYPVILNQTGSYVYKGGYYGDVEFPIQPGGQLTASAIFNVKPGMSIWNGKPLPAPASFPLAVVNATGTANQATSIASVLGRRGFRVVATGNRTPVGQTAETVVWYGGPPPPKQGNWSSPSLEYALSVMPQLRGPVILGYNPAALVPGSVVTIQTGTDLTVAPLPITPPKSTTTTTGATTTTAHGTTTHPVTATTVPDVPLVSSDNRFSAPTATAQPLAAWDPRACNAAGTGPATTTTTAKTG